MGSLEAAKQRKLAFFAALIAAASCAGAGRALAATCQVPSVPHPSIASAANDPSCSVIDLVLQVYASYLQISPIYYESGITISHDTAIIGNNSIIDGGNSGHSVFTVNPARVFSVNNVLIQHGKAAGGGAINNTGGIVEVANSTFFQNSATSSNVNTGGGGAIRNFGLAALQNSVFAGNSAAFGGAVNDHEAKGLIITGCTFTNNSGNNGGHGSGGAVFIDEFSTASISDSVFKANSTDGEGGAILTEGGNKSQSLPPVTITNTSFNENNANRDGGAIAFEAGHQSPATVLSNDTFSGNNSAEGGAVYYAHGNDHDALLTVTNSTFSNNSSSGDGGALWVSNVTTITGSDINGNFAHKSGGGIFETTSDGALDLNHDSLIDDRACVAGGALDVDNGTATITNTTFAGDTIGGPGCI